MARYSIDDAENAQRNGDTTGTLLDRLRTVTRPMNGSLQLLHVFSSALINEVKAGINRVGVRMFQVQQTPLPYALTTPGYTTLLDRGQGPLSTSLRSDRIGMRQPQNSPADDAAFAR
jgi:hypothetical protein